MTITNEMVRDLAAKEAVCVRPVLRKVTDRETGEVHKLVIPCGSTREYACPPCAKKAQRLRMQQCRVGWHLDHDPIEDNEPTDEPEDHDVQGEVDDSAAEDEPSRRVRSTRRRSDAVDLPRVPAEKRTVGRTFEAPDGTVYRPSMFVTLTLGSYGRVITPVKGKAIAGAGAPVEPVSYDYRRAALEALHFPKLFDRWVQNLRRCAGFVVQYFGAIEAQRRLAPHIHVALRGAIPRETLRQVTAATYLQLWWPPHETIVYTEDRLPVWDDVEETYRDADTGFVLPTWEEALDALDQDPEARPALVMRFGKQLDIQGIIAPSADADRSIRYLTKYLTKDVAETYVADEGPQDLVYERHITRLWDHVEVLPCAPECLNWLRYGVQPKNPGPRPERGACPAKAHTRECLGIGGRRVQVSRHWSGKTLSEHRADRAAVVREVLLESGITAPDTDRWSTEHLADDGQPRFVWEMLPVDDRDYVHVVTATILEARRWRSEYEAAKAAVDSRAGPREINSATTRPRPPDRQPRSVG